jgi:WD40 repeat protein
LGISPDGNHLASGDKQGTLRVYDLTNYECIQNMDAHDTEILTLDYSSPISSEGTEFAACIHSNTHISF